MTQAPGKINTADLPVLTEVADASAMDIPVLTEVHTPQQMTFDVPSPATLETTDTPAPEPLSEAACAYLAAQIMPQVDALLQEAVRDIKSRLPEMIRTALDNDTHQ
ncbi:MAG: hypothetical protein Q7S51_12130 [Gallionellaceae bacterium]|nr:hypothetical protein [Gallionellaceae bacterium]